MQHTYYRGRQRTLWDRIWKDRQDRVVIWQNPNAWLIGWAVLTMVSLLLSRGLVADICSWAASASLIVWSFLEISRGVNYFRRVLGAVVLVFAIASLIKIL